MAKGKAMVRAGGITTTTKARFQGNCDSCGKPGHKAKDCWSAGGGAANPKAKAKGKGKDGPKGRGRGKGVGSLDESAGAQQEPEQETGALEACFGCLDMCNLDRQCQVLWKGGEVLARPLNRTTKTYAQAVTNQPETRLKYVKMTLDTGAAATAFPEEELKDYDVIDQRKGSYKTASGEIDHPRRRWQGTTRVRRPGKLATATWPSRTPQGTCLSTRNVQGKPGHMAWRRRRIRDPKEQPRWQRHESVL